MDVNEREKLLERLASRTVSRDQLEQDADALAKDAEILAEDMAHFAADIKISGGIVRDPLIGTVVDQKFEVLELLGDGGMGSVYKARHKVIGKVVALKVLHRKLALEESSRVRFQHEAKATSQLSHPNLVSVYDFGFLPTGEPFIAMDFVGGESLAKAIESGPLESERARDIFKQIAEGLAHAHAKGVIHRDLKPSNVILTKTEKGADRVTILDFGIAKILEAETPQQITQTGEVFGSPPYMSPEQCMGNKLDSRSDIYSFGCLMYETLAGAPAFLGENAMQTIFKHVNEDAPPFDPALKVPTNLQNIVFRCLKRNPEERFRTCLEIDSALAQKQNAVVFANAAPHKLMSSGYLMHGPRLALLGVLVFAVALFAFVMTHLPSTPAETELSVPSKSASATEPPEQLWHRAIDLQDHARLGEANEILTEALKMPQLSQLDKVRLLYQRSYGYSLAGDSEKAVADGRAAVQLADKELPSRSFDRAWAASLLAQAYAKAHQYADEDATYTKVMALAPKALSPLQTADLHGYWAESLYERKEYKHAYLQFQEAAKFAKTVDSAEARQRLQGFAEASAQVVEKLRSSGSATK